MYVSTTNTEGVMVILMIPYSDGGHIGFKNAIGRHFAHPPENVVLDNYELISIDRRKVCTKSPLKVISS